MPAVYAPLPPTAAPRPDARALIEDWRLDYNQLRPHTSLAGMTPQDLLLDLTGRMRPARSKPHRQVNLFEEAQTRPGLSSLLDQQRGQGRVHVLVRLSVSRDGVSEVLVDGEFRAHSTS